MGASDIAEDSYLAQSFNQDLQPLVNGVLNRGLSGQNTNAQLGKMKTSNVGGNVCAHFKQQLLQTFFFSTPGVFLVFADECVSVDVFVCLCFLKPIYLIGPILCLSLKGMAAVPIPLNVVSCMGGTNYNACAHIASFQRERLGILYYLAKMEEKEGGFLNFTGSGLE
ncbi:hypothetical protein GOODEAATRI_028702 [Goodea atripinnis]|uniref:Uncharacterized protein n=1 Tax=Goodea atripinnis TaxID=208336 RepID=A0ABV0NYL1_9TELE